MVRTRKNGLTVLLVAVLFACLAALSFFVPTKGVSAADGTWQDKAVVTIENGDFDIAINLVDNESATDANINISGGDFTQAFDGAYLASDAVLYPTADGAFAVADQATAEQETIGVAQIGQVIYETLADALAAAQDGDEIDLLTNISAPGAINITNDITLDFNGYAIDSNRTIAIIVAGANANIISTGARGTLNTPANGISVINGSNVEISDIDINTEIYILKKDDGSQQVYDGRAIQIVGSTAVIDNVVTSLTADNADYTVAHWYIGDSDVTITNSSVTLVYTRSAASAENGSLQGYAVYSDNSDVTIENSSISSTGDETAYGVIFFGNMAIADAAAANGEGFKTLSLTDTTVIADAFAVSGNGTPNDCSGTDIVITGDCKIKSNYAQAIYHPQYGVLTINLTEDSALAYIRGVSGIEMRAGELVVIGGYIEATGDELDSMPNGNGSTTSGAAIAIVQHTTKQPINVRLDGGVFNGVFAVYEENQQNNEQAAVEKISLAINGGVFNGRIGSENLVDFVNGGTFSEIPNYNYFADGYVWTDNGDGTYGVEQSEETFVAVINGIGYTSLLEAMEAAPEGATITLIDEVVIDTEVTLDLSGYVIVIDETFPSDTYDVAIRVIEGGALTITGDGVIDAKLAGDNVVPVAAMRANSSIIMNGGTIIVDTPSESCLFAMGGSITINGGTLENLCEDEYSYGGGRTQVVNISNGTPGKLVINGGTFIGRNPALGDDNLGGTFIAEDAKLAQSTDENGNVVYVALGQDETVAGVDAVYYVENGLAVAEVYTAAALADALAATTGADKNPAYDVIKLGDDISGNIVVDESRTLTIDLNGYTLTGEGDHTIVNNGTLTITDSVGGGKVVATADSKAALLNYGDATLLGGEFTRETAGTGGWYVIKNYGSLVIGEENKECGVVVDSNGGDESSLLVSGYYDADDEAANEGLITSANPLKVVINGGTFNGGLNTIKNDSKSVMTINGGTFTNGKNYTVQNCNEMTVNGGTFVQTASKNVYGSKAVYALYSDDNTQLTITAGDFTAVTYAVYLKDNVNAVISGGTFEGETALYAGKKVTLTISGGAFTGTENYGISIDANAVVDISGEETVISGSEYGLRVRSAYGNINISDATISGETAVYMNRPTSYAITSGVFNGAINVTNNTAGISGGKFAVMPNEAYFIEGLTGALVDGYYVTVKATSPVEELRPAIFEAQAAVRSYAAALGINWADIASARAADAQAVLAAYDAIESAASVDLVLVAQLNAMDALDEYAAALAAELDAYKAEKIAALETLAGDGYVPAYAIAAINGAASVAEVDACYNAAVAEINAADDGEITPPAPSDNGDGVSLTGVYVMLGVILVVAVAALMILLLKKQKQAEAAEAAEAKAAAPLDRELAEVKQAVEADETAAAVSAAAEDDDKEQIVIEANVRTFDEAYDELDDEQKKLFNDVKDYALTKEGAALTELSSGVCVKKGSKQIVKLTVRRGNPVALFVIENEMIKDFRRNSDAPVKLKVKATELVLRSGGDLEAAKAMVDVAVDQIEKDILAAKERRREARRLRRQRKREQKRQ